MNRALRYAGQTAVYLAIAVLLGVFSNRPVYLHFPADEALIKLSIAHGGRRKAECRRRTAQELAKLPHWERKPFDCPRARHPVFVELSLDGKLLFSRLVPPGGLADDGPSRVYERFRVPAGRHVLVARLRDSGRKEGYDYQRRVEVTLAPRRNLVVTFSAAEGGFAVK